MKSPYVSGADFSAAIRARPADLHARLERALVRRFGQPIDMSFSKISEAESGVAGGALRCTDLETGSWVQGYMARKRFRITAEFDGA